ncbi:MAG TPA: phosphatidylserine decarboxylase family protein [Candidatus Acidoferrales bacterium]|nr:phosphatidylserine decarboxylase family protein [Candidatus Acidoferrales bacterium]
MFLRLAHYGYDVVAVVVLSCVAAVFVSFFVASAPAKVILDIAALAAGASTFYFFRDPDRTLQMSGDHVVISPADGRVVFCSEVEEPEFLRSRAKMISIFMSPVDVHVNRIPVNGTVKFLKYVKGEYLVAFDEKSSDRNERMLIGIENKGARVLFKQIAGFIARRIVCNLSEGQTVTAGERFGMIKFGSRVDVLLPLNCDVKVKLNDKIFAGSTIIGVMQSEP